MRLDRADEGSNSPNGLHNLWILKTFMNVSFVFIAVACWAAIVRNVSRQNPPRLWRVLWSAFPATFLLVNLAIYYGLYTLMTLFAAEGATSREISRGPVFGSLEFGNYELTYTVIAALIIAPILVLVLRAMDPSRKSEA